MKGRERRDSNPQPADRQLLIFVQAFLCPYFLGNSAIQVYGVQKWGRIVQGIVQGIVDLGC